jgi:hypothetical protein
MAPCFFYQKGRGAQKKKHGAAPFYFSLDKTLVMVRTEILVGFLKVHSRGFYRNSR